MFKKKRFVIGGLVILIGLGFLLFRGFVGGATYYLEVGELLQKSSSLNGEKVRVNGQVAPGTVEQSNQGRTLKFVMTDMNDVGQSLTVYFEGVVPDSFKVGNQVVAEGKLDQAGVFQATTLMPKCPSKYTPVG